MKCVIIYFKVFSGRTNGERICKDQINVLEGVNDKGLITLGIMNTTGNMGNLGNFSHENN